MRRMVTNSGLARTGDLQTLSGLLEYEALPGSNSPDHADTKALADYQRILEDIRAQLQRKFSRPDDPQLYWRRRKLHELFDSVPFPFVKELLSRLENSADPLGLLLISRVAPVTRREMLGVLHTKLTLTPPEPDLRRDVMNLLTRGAPLPVALEPEFQKAADRIDLMLQQSLFDGTRDADQVLMLLCMIQTLRQPNANDTVILWGKRCSMEQLKRNPKRLCIMRFGPGDIHYLKHHQEDYQKQNDRDGKTFNSVLPSDLMSRFTFHLKPILLDLHLVNPSDEDEESLFNSLKDIVSEVQITLKELSTLFDFPDQATKNQYHPGLSIIRFKIEGWKQDQRTFYSCLS